MLSWPTYQYNRNSHCGHLQRQRSTTMNTFVTRWSLFSHKLLFWCTFNELVLFFSTASDSVSSPNGRYANSIDYISKPESHKSKWDSPHYSRCSQLTQLWPIQLTFNLPRKNLVWTLCSVHLFRKQRGLPRVIDVAKSTVRNFIILGFSFNIKQFFLNHKERF